MNSRHTISVVTQPRRSRRNARVNVPIPLLGSLRDGRYRLVSRFSLLYPPIRPTASAAFSDCAQRYSTFPWRKWVYIRNDRNYWSWCARICNCMTKLRGFAAFPDSQVSLIILPMFPFSIKAGVASAVCVTPESARCQAENSDIRSLLTC